MRRLTLVLAAAALSAAACSRAPVDVALPTDSWPTNGGDLYNRRYSPLTAINRDNVGGLKGVWRARLEGSGVGPQYSGEAQPLVAGDSVYVSTGASDVFAIALDSGAIRWSFRASLDPAIDVVCCGWTSRGVAVGEGKVFAGLLDGRLVALDQATGEPVWSVQAERWQDGSRSRARRSTTTGSS
jgi:alcohol dehydrogenase (cytochrome c)